MITKYKVISGHFEYTEDNLKDVGIIMTNVEGILEFKEKFPELSKEYCISYREYNYGCSPLTLIHTSLLAVIFAEILDLSCWTNNPNYIHLPESRNFSSKDAINNYVNKNRNDLCQFYTLDNWKYDSDWGLYCKIA